MPFYKRLILQLLVVLNCLTISVSAQNFLEVPVKLEVEKGDLSEVVVKVKKDGKDAFTQSGAGKMRFKLDFNKKYTLVFTKPGYITKTIEVNTSAPASRIGNGFEPYKIGVKLFLQNEENMVVYNQPVAQIKYDANIDEFNFDTDYSKSILSAISRDQSEEEKPAPPAAAPAPAPVTASATPEPELSKPVEHPSGKEETAQPPAPVAQAAEPTPAPAPAPPNAQQESPAVAAPVKTEDTPAPAPMVADEERPSGKKMGEGDHSRRASSGSGGQDMKKTAAAQAGEDSGRRSPARSGQDNLTIPVPRREGNEAPPAFNKPSASTEAPPAGPQFTEEERVTREDIVEKNRVITRIKVIKGGVTTEYSRVNYSWGGEFYFRNSTQSISSNLFVHWTGLVK